MGFKQPAAKEHPQANMLAGMPTLVAILDVDLISVSVISQVEEDGDSEPKSSDSQPEPTSHPSPSI